MCSIATEECPRYRTFPSEKVLSDSAANYVGIKIELGMHDSSYQLELYPQGFVELLRMDVDG